MIKDRVIQLIEYKGIAKEVFYKKIGMTSASFRGKAKESPLNSNAIENILSEIPDANPEWLLTGNGKMLRGEKKETPTLSPSEKQQLEDKIHLLENTIKDKEKIIKLQEEQLKHSKKVNLEMPPLRMAAEPQAQYPVPPLIQEHAQKHKKEPKRKQ